MYVSLISKNSLCNLRKHVSMCSQTNNDVGSNSPLRARTFQLNADLRFTCSQTGVKGHPTSIGVAVNGSLD